MAASPLSPGAGRLALVWIAAATLYIAKATLTAGTTPLILDTDDAMRLVEVHDFLGGQNWFDLVQHRLNAPFGAEMHWSRLVDLPEAILLTLLRPVFGAGAGADTALACAWPLLLLLPLLWLTARIAQRLGGSAALWPALLLVPLSLVTLGEFAPGRVDHHSAQILLSLCMLEGMLASLERPGRAAAGAGLAAGIALAIGIEGLPVVGAIGIAYALLWVTDARHAAALRDFGLGFACATALGLAQGVAPANWLVLRLDAISIVYVAAALLCAIAFGLLSLLRWRRPASRLLAVAAAGLVAGALLLWLDPALLRGPYAALDPWLVANWLSHIAESATFAGALSDDPVYPLAVGLPVLLALAYALARLTRGGRDRAAWLAYALLLLVGIAVMLIQVRAARIATPLAMPGCATLIAASLAHARRRAGLLPALGVVAAWIGSAGLAIAVPVALLPLPAAHQLGGADRQACLMPASFAGLAALPPQRLMAPIDLGSHILLYTPHSVVGAPYHRNQQGLLDTFRFFNGPIEAGRALLAARGITRVVICPAMREIRGMVEHAPDSFVSLYAEKRLPDWLMEEPGPGPLVSYAVRAP